MAIDTRNKRASAGAAALAWLVALPTPDGTVDASDRAQSAGMYSGIAVAAQLGPLRMVAFLGAQGDLSSVLGDSPDLAAATALGGQLDQPATDTPDLAALDGTGADLADVDVVET